jgi:hypothetical protein
MLRSFSGILRKFLIKSSITLAGINRANSNSKYARSPISSCIPTKIIPKIIMNIEGITNANINVSMYLLIIIDDTVDAATAGLARF